MDIFEQIGFIHFWGLSPSINFIDYKFEKDSLNVLLSGTSDIRHILKTCSEHCRNNNYKQIRIYFHEKQKELTCRLLLLLLVLHQSNLNFREKTELFLDIYGNAQIREKTSRYIDYAVPLLQNFIADDTKYKTTCLKELVDLSLIKFKERDEMVEVLGSWRSKVEFNMEKNRDQRLRYHYKERYDFRKNLIDWDYQMGLREWAPIINFQHYREWRQTGVAFEYRFSTYIQPNRTMSSYLPGKKQNTRESCLVRGYWGDILLSPYIAFGVDTDIQPEKERLFKICNKQYVGNSLEVTQFNLYYQVNMLESFTEHHMVFTDFYRKEDDKPAETKNKKLAEIKEGGEEDDQEQDENEEEKDNEKDQKEMTPEDGQKQNLDNAEQQRKEDLDEQQISDSYNKIDENQQKLEEKTTQREGDEDFKLENTQKIEENAKKIEENNKQIEENQKKIQENQDKIEEQTVKIEDVAKQNESEEILETKEEQAKGIEEEIAKTQKTEEDSLNETQDTIKCSQEDKLKVESQKQDVLNQTEVKSSDKPSNKTEVGKEKVSQKDVKEEKKILKKAEKKENVKIEQNSAKGKEQENQQQPQVSNAEMIQKQLELQQKQDKEQKNEESKKQPKDADLTEAELKSKQRREKEDLNDFFDKETIDFEVLEGLKRLNIKLIPLYDDLKTLSGKPKWQEFFDIGVIGFVFSALFADKSLPRIFKKNATVFAETSEYLVPLKKEDRTKYYNQILQVAEEQFKKTDYAHKHHIRFVKK